jgi:hypothetical protein
MTAAAGLRCRLTARSLSVRRSAGGGTLSEVEAMVREACGARTVFEHIDIRCGHAQAAALLRCLAERGARARRLTLGRWRGSACPAAAMRNAAVVLWPAGALYALADDALAAASLVGAALRHGLRVDYEWGGAVGGAVGGAASGGPGAAQLK